MENPEFRQGYWKYWNKVRVFGDKMSKIIYLVRHGEAVNDRLTLRGREQIVDVAETIEKELPSDVSSIVVYHGPRGRARESAEIFAEELSYLAVVKLCHKEELDCENFLVHKVVDAIDEPLSIVVSHRPDLEEYAYMKYILASFEKTGSYCKLF